MMFSLLQSLKLYSVFTEIEDIMINHAKVYDVSTRVRFVRKDVMDLRAYNWILRHDRNGKPVIMSREGNIISQIIESQSECRILFQKWSLSSYSSEQ